MKENRHRIAVNKANLRKMEEIWDLHAICLQKIKALAAYGDDCKGMAIGMLAIVAWEAVGKLNPLAEQYPDLVVPLARNTVYWPALISHKQSVKKENRDLLVKLQVGKGGISSSGKWQPDALSTRGAFNVLSWGESFRLPKLTASNKKKWFNRAWALMIQLGFKPEEHRELARLATSKAVKKPKYCKTLHARTRVANMRAEIKRRIWEAFDHVFSPPRK